MTELLLGDKRIQLYAQPIVSLKNKTNNFEVLLAAFDKEKRMHTGHFIDTLERSGDIISVDKWVLQSTLEWLEWLESQEGKAGSVERAFVNISGYSLSDESFRNFIFDLHERNESVFKKLCIEITETSKINNIKDVSDWIALIKEKGTHIAIDDFGSGYSALRYLRYFPANCVKIDGEMIANMLKEPNGLIFVEWVVDLARAINIKSIAEWVETPLLLRKLNAMGVDYVQGFVFGTPAPIGTIIHRCENARRQCDLLLGN